MSNSLEIAIDAKYCDLNHDQLPFENQSFDLIFAEKHRASD